MGYGRTNIAGGGLRIKSMQSGTFSRDNMGTWEDITISPVDLASSIALIQVECIYFDQDEDWYTIEFRDNKTIRIWRMDNDAQHRIVHWQVLELAGFKSLQYATASVVRSSTNEYLQKAYATIQKVNLDKCLVFTSLRFDNPGDYRSNAGWVRLSDSTHVEVANANANRITVIGNAFVVELR